MRGKVEGASCRKFAVGLQEPVTIKASNRTRSYIIGRPRKAGKSEHTHTHMYIYVYYIYIHIFLHTHTPTDTTSYIPT